tara:strand:- start:202 stop:390 length:189 start_codon:yes stop_codon:yes gene_type:complete
MAIKSLVLDSDQVEDLLGWFDDYPVAPGDNVNLMIDYDPITLMHTLVSETLAVSIGHNNPTD